jgi:hypothetical protein
MEQIPLEGRRGEPAPANEELLRRERVAITLVGATLWPDAARMPGRTLRAEDPGSLLKSAASEERRIWLQLKLESDEATTAAQEWFEGSLDAWETIRDPEVDWHSLQWLSELMALCATSDDASQSYQADLMLSVLPHLYGRGISRAERDAFPDDKPPPRGVQLFPTIGFALAERRPPKQAKDRTNFNGGLEDLNLGQKDRKGGEMDEEPNSTADSQNQPSPAFWALRTNIAVIGNIVVTIRLPDLLCAGREAREVDPRENSYFPHRRDFRIPSRFFPVREISAIDIAEGIAHHQAATARSASEELRGRLSDIELESAASDGTRHEARKCAQAQHDLILDMSATVDQLDRQVSRLLRRFGSHGDDNAKEKLVPREAKLRYRFALDEIRSLRDDCQRAADAIQARIASHDQDDRNRFELAAALLASVILTPTLVAGLYGANVNFPGENSGRGAIALGLAIFAFIAIGIFAMSVAWTHDWRRFSERFNRRQFRIAVALIALAFLTATVLVSTKVI